MSKVKKILVCKNEKGFATYEKIDIDSYQGTAEECAVSNSFVMDLFRIIMGRTLTIIDASVIDRQQNKAMKDLLREIFNAQMQFTADMVFNQDELSKMAEESFDEDNVESVTIEEALGVK